MSPKEPSTQSDRQSESPRRSGRPAVPRIQILSAAERLIADAAEPAGVTMDAIALAAGVGKGTLFRAFGSRDGLLDAVFEAHLAPLRRAFSEHGSPVGPGVAPVRRIAGILHLLLDFKLDNPQLAHARETTAVDLLHSPHYIQVHRLVRGLVEDSGQTTDAANYLTHLLLAGLRAEVLTELLSAGDSIEGLHEKLDDSVRRLLGASPEQVQPRS